MAKWVKGEERKGSRKKNQKAKGKNQKAKIKEGISNDSWLVFFTYSSFASPISPRAH
jgi:hypothetical protein